MKRPSFERARVSDAMRPGVISCPPDASLRTVARIMSTNRVHAVVVGDAGQRLTRAISERELLAASARDVSKLSAADATVSDMLTVAPHDTLARAVEAMVERRATHALVVDGTGAPAGILSAFDVARVLAEDGAHEEAPAQPDRA